jgi:hypothetical protein
MGVHKMENENEGVANKGSGGLLSHVCIRGFLQYTS